jgi:Replication-relaxation
VTNADTAGLLEDLEKRHAFVKTGTTAYSMETRDTKLLQIPVTAQEAAKRLSQVREQTRARYCVSRAELAEREAEAIEEETHETPPPEALPPEPELIPIDMQEPEPLLEEVPEPELQRPEPPARKEPIQPPEPEQIPVSMDTMNTLYAQLKAKEIDPDTTILASLGEHYVFTIRQWMRLFAWKSYPKATAHFKTLVDTKLIVRKDREGRGGSLVTGDWFFLLTKGANELARRKQPSPPFKLEPNEAAKASGDTLFHTFLVNEVLIHLRLLERQYPDIVTIESIDHERSMRRAYLQALGSDTKLYPDGFLRLLVPTPNGLKRKYTFLELQHTTQKDKHNWQTKVRKYLDLFARTETLATHFHTRTPRVLVLTMDEEYVSYHTQWTEEVLAERGEKGRGYGSRFMIGSYDSGISDMSTAPLQFFCAPRFSIPFTDTLYPVFAPPETTP